MGFLITLKLSPEQLLPDDGVLATLFARKNACLPIFFSDGALA